MATKGSQTEYNPLRKVVLGRLDPGNQFPSDDLGMLAAIAADEELYTDDGRLNLSKAADLVPYISPHIQETTARELSELETFYRSKGVEVIRPKAVKPHQKIITPDFETTSFPVYCPRDILFNFRDLLIISPNLYQSRIDEATFYADILNGERSDGRIVIQAPRPRLRPQDFNLSNNATSILATQDPVFEAANILIDGEHNAIYYQISNSGNLPGFEWLQGVINKHYPEVTVYPMNVYKGTHFDTTIAILNYDTVALNPERITSIEDLPDPLRKRKHIFPKIIDTTHKEGLSSKWIGMNSFSVNPKTIVVDADQEAYIEQLIEEGFEVFPHKLTYCDVIEGGHHCTTSDLQREETY